MKSLPLNFFIAIQPVGIRIAFEMAGILRSKGCGAVTSPLDTDVVQTVLPFNETDVVLLDYDSTKKEECVKLVRVIKKLRPYFVKFDYPIKVIVFCKQGQLEDDRMTEAFEKAGVDGYIPWGPLTMDRMVELILEIGSRETQPA